MDSILWSRGLAFPFQLVMMALNQEAHCTVTLRHFKRTLRDCWTTREWQTCSPKSCEIGFVQRIEVLLILILILKYVYTDTNQSYLPDSSSLLFQALDTGLYGWTHSLAHFVVGDTVDLVHVGFTVGCFAHWETIFGAGLSQTTGGLVVCLVQLCVVGLVVSCSQIESCAGFFTQLETVS